MGKVLGIVNQKGGVGKTTSTIELAAAFVAQKKKVLVIDLDQQGNLSKYVNADLSKPTIFDVLQAESATIDAIQKCGTFDVIASSKELSKADRTFTEYQDLFLLEDVIKPIKDNYHFILIDNGPSRSTLLTMAYVASDGIVIPTEADDGSIDGIWEVHNDLVTYRDGAHPVSHAKIELLLLNKYENTVMHQNAKEALQDISSEISDNPLVETIRKSIIASESKSFRQSIQEYSPKNNAAEDYRSVAKKLVRRMK
ncbi:MULTISPECIES: ParA family protein [unclassified Butyrivibrio]|uniref:ParA family protein n=1 Tax=unclassified Butyrivibrio TaxID=2639466 RepID=UPI0004142C18|nr:MULTISPECIES: ParA family protein [unclassified Butyrivibrio]